MKYNNMVRTFMEAMGQDMPANPAIPKPNIVALRASLIEEENKELSEAAANNDIVEVVDALCDLRYVVEGAFAAYGISPELADELFEEVQRSNMSKLCKTTEEAADTGDKYDKEGVATFPQQVGDFYAIIRISDGKVLKSINYSPPDLKTILERHEVTCG